MDSIVNTFSFELEHGGPHVHFLAFLLFIFIGIVILHGVFRIVIEVLSRVTKIPRDIWRNIFPLPRSEYPAPPLSSSSLR